MIRFLLTFSILLCAAPVFAQTYVAAALSADLSLLSESSFNGATFPDGDRETIGWALRLGTALGSRWGVELEFHRSGELETESDVLPYAVTPISYAISSGPGGTTIAGLDNLSSIATRFPPRTRQRTMTWNTLAWVQQAIGTRADLVLLGGIGFARSTQETDFSIPFALSGLPPESFRSESTTYGVGPLVGAEVRIRMTDHLALTPGLRVQSLGDAQIDGLLVRPSVALGWGF